MQETFLSFRFNKCHPGYVWDCTSFCPTTSKRNPTLPKKHITHLKQPTLLLTEQPENTPLFHLHSSKKSGIAHRDNVCWTIFILDLTNSWITFKLALLNSLCCHVVSTVMSLCNTTARMIFRQVCVYGVKHKQREWKHSYTWVIFSNGVWC